MIMTEVTFEKPALAKMGEGLTWKYCGTVFCDPAISRPYSATIQRMSKMSFLNRKHFGFSVEEFGINKIPKIIIIKMSPFCLPVFIRLTTLNLILQVNKDEGTVFKILGIRIPVSVIQCYVYLRDRTELNTQDQ